MSRLYQKRQKKTKLRTLLLIILIPILSFYIFRSGFELLINSAVFVNSLFSKNNLDSTTEIRPDDFFGTIALDPPREATNSARIILTGQSNGFEIGEIYLNGTKVDESQFPTEDFYLFEIADLVEGENKVYIIAKTKDNKYQKQSEEYTVLFIGNPPSLTIESPQDGQKFDKPDVEIKGKSDKNTDIIIANLPALSAANGEFSGKIRLKEGENLVEITSRDIAGNIARTELKLIYEPDN